MVFIFLCYPKKCKRSISRTKEGLKWQKDNSIQKGGPKGWNEGDKKDWNKEKNNGKHNRNNSRRGQSGGRKNGQGS